MRLKSLRLCFANPAFVEISRQQTLASEFTSLVLYQDTKQKASNLQNYASGLQNFINIRMGHIK